MALTEGKSARAVPEMGKGDGPAAPRLSVVVDDAIALYDVDHERKRVLLLEVARRFRRSP